MACVHRVYQTWKSNDFSKSNIKKRLWVRVNEFRFLSWIEWRRRPKVVHRALHYFHLAFHRVLGLATDWRRFSRCSFLARSVIGFYKIKRNVTKFWFYRLGSKLEMYDLWRIVVYRVIGRRTKGVVVGEMDLELRLHSPVGSDDLVLQWPLVSYEVRTESVQIRIMHTLIGMHTLLNRIKTSWTEGFDNPTIHLISISAEMLKASCG